MTVSSIPSDFATVAASDLLRASEVRNLILSKSLVLGALGGIIGFALGTGVAVLLEADGCASESVGMMATVEYFGVAQAMGIAACVLGSWLPARSAAATDPAQVLHEE